MGICILCSWHLWVRWLWTIKFQLLCENVFNTFRQTPGVRFVGPLAMFMSIFSAIRNEWTISKVSKQLCMSMPLIGGLDYGPLLPLALWLPGRSWTGLEALVCHFLRCVRASSVARCVLSEGEGPCSQVNRPMLYANSFLRHNSLVTLLTMW